MTPAPKLIPTEKAAKALAQLSDAEWAQVRRAEERRRSEQHTIRDLAKEPRELRDRKEPRTRCVRGQKGSAR